MSLSIAITHAPTEERREMLATLLRSLGTDFEAVKAQLVDLSVIADPHFRGVWPTTRRALVQGVRVGATHHLVLQDDALACRDFIEGAKLAISAVPASPLALQCGHPYTDKANRLGLTWTRLERCEINSIAMVFPTALVPSMLRWVDTHFRASYKHSDVRIECWAYETRNYLWATDPSLIQNVGMNRSLLGHNGHESHIARRFLGSDVSATTIDFTLGADNPAVSRAKMPQSIRKVML